MNELKEPTPPPVARYRLHVWGDGACFTRPEMKVERVSYEVMTPSAARGVLEAILWKPQMRWRVRAIDVLKPIRFGQIRRNEVASKASLRKIIVADEDRQQRAMLYLADVGYVIHADIELTEKAGPDDTLAKYRGMFERRASTGQCFQRPVLGTREFAADFRLLAADDHLPSPVAETKGLGFMFLDFDHSKHPWTPLFFAARLDRGRLAVPDDAPPGATS